MPAARAISAAACSRHEAAPPHRRLDEAVPLQVLIGLLHRDDADVDGLGKRPHRGDGVPCLELAGHDHGLDLAGDLLIDRLAAV